MTCVAAAAVVHSLVACATGSSRWMRLLGVTWLLPSYDRRGPGMFAQGPTVRSGLWIVVTWTDTVVQAVLPMVLGPSG